MLALMDFSQVRLIVVDMDGTLLNAQHELSVEFPLLYEQLQELGIRFAAASGRQYESILDKLPQVGQELIVLAENGAHVVYEGELYDETTLSNAAIQEVLAAVADRTDVHATLCTRGCAYTQRSDPEFGKVVREFYKAHDYIDDLTAYQGEAYKATLNHAESSEQHIYPLVEHLAPELMVKVSGQHWVDVSVPEANKGRALSVMQRELGISRAETMAFGDYLNDLEMLAHAEFSFAMANAHPAVKQAARFTTASNDERGVDQVLRQLIEQRKRRYV